MKEFYRLLKVMKAHPYSPMAIATVIRVEGSAYRHEGAKMLFVAEEPYGTISAGCLENDLAYRAQEVMESKVPQTISYDLRAGDALSWGQSAGCNGKITIYVEPVAWNSTWEQLEGLLDAGEKILYARGIGERAITPFYLASQNGKWLPSRNEQSRPDFHAIIESFIDTNKTFALIDQAEWKSTILLEIYEPKDRLYVFGAGPDAEPLVELAEKMDFATTVIDPRSSRCCDKYFPSAHQLIVEHPETFLKEGKIPDHSYVLIMTHNFDRDRTILNHLIKQQVNYLGALGPRRRTERLLAPTRLPDRVYSPVGMDIGAEGPEEISVSIVAQLLKVRNERKAFSYTSLLPI